MTTSATTEYPFFELTPQEMAKITEACRWNRNAFNEWFARAHPDKKLRYVVENTGTIPFHTTSQKAPTTNAWVYFEPKSDSELFRESFEHLIARCPEKKTAAELKPTPTQEEIDHHTRIIISRYLYQNGYRRR